MNSQKSVRGARWSFMRWVMAVGATALVVTTIFTVLCADPAMAAAGSGTRSTIPAKVKYFVVPRSAKGAVVESLYEIAAQTLGDGNRYPQIFALNKGRLQPGGGRLENPRVIEPGWILRLPPDASGPKVHFGPLPTVTVKAIHRQATSPPSAQPSRLTTARARTSDSMADQVLVLGVILVVVMTAALTLSGTRRRTGRRVGLRAGTPAPGTGDPWMGSAGQFLRPDVPEDVYPSWPGQPGPGALHPDHPSWPGRPDPRWAAAEAGLLTSEFPRWPESPQASRGARQMPAAHNGMPPPVRRRPGPTGAGFAPQVAPVPACVTEDRPTSAPQARTATTGPPIRRTPGPAVRPGARPAVKTGARPHARPAGRPKPRHAARQKPAPAVRPEARPRQYAAKRGTPIATAALVLIALASGTTELALHGYRFFVFRSAGTGKTLSSS